MTARFRLATPAERARTLGEAPRFAGIIAETRLCAIAVSIAMDRSKAPASKRSRKPKHTVLAPVPLPAGAPDVILPKHPGVLLTK